MEEKIRNLKSDLKSITKHKLRTERDASNLRVAASYLCNELSTIKSELQFLFKNLEFECSFAAVDVTASKLQTDYAARLLLPCSPINRTPTASWLHGRNAVVPTAIQCCPSESKWQISNARHQLAMIGICTASERSKVNSHIHNLNVHEKGFNELFNKERLLLETREKELREKEADELEIARDKKKMAATRNEQRVREAATVDAEADAIEKACIVLKVSLS
ncbi:hypothetical protein MSG28_008628 [Choristoneura fumiferana]|uniref:Uncharacterized protein n=1 Tax=Choristoneura fumiferana TaxID=7141 RepID=A0ACC0J7H3_CHOFU|nr:hypothetical protein MSG28_008628 [Choristoneura fumiferana]